MNNGSNWGVFRDGVGLVSTFKGQTREEAADQAQKLNAFNGQHARYYVKEM